MSCTQVLCVCARVCAHTCAILCVCARAHTYACPWACVCVCVTCGLMYRCGVRGVILGFVYKCE